MSHQPAPRPLGTPSDPAADIKFVNDTIQKHLEKSLTKEDRATLELANKKLITYTATGFWLGTLVGAGWAFRSRWSAIARIRRAPGSSPAAGGSFYPTRNPQAAESSVKEVVEKLRAEGAPQENRMGSLVKAMGWGMLGAFGGSQVGLWSGRRSAQNVVTSSGHEERISKNLALAMRNAATEVSAHSGKAIGSFKLPGMSQADWNATEQEDGDHVEEEEKEEAALAPSEGFYANETVDDQSNERDTSAADSSAPSSRWDQLRQAKPAAASTWDTIRDTSSRASLPSSRPSPTPSPSPSTDKLSEVDAEKERRRREFEDLMDKERKGGDDFGSDSKWK